MELTLLIESGREPISGSIGAAGEPPVAFSGYMQLIAALERALDVGLADAGLPGSEGD